MKDEEIKRNIEAIKLAISELAARGVRVDYITPVWEAGLGGVPVIRSLKVDTDIL
jgi:hypothetical protein